MQKVRQGEKRVQGIGCRSIGRSCVHTKSGDVRGASLFLWRIGEKMRAKEPGFPYIAFWFEKFKRRRIECRSGAISLLRERRRFQLEWDGAVVDESAMTRLIGP